MGGRSLSLSVAFNSPSTAPESSVSAHTSRSDAQPSNIFMKQNGHSQHQLTSRESNSSGHGRRRSLLNQPKPLAVVGDSRGTAVSTPEGPTAGPVSRAKLRKPVCNVPKDADAASDKDSEYSRPMKALEDEERRQKMAASSSVDLPTGNTSLVPDSLPVELSQDIPNAGPSLPRYNVYNPIGPRWYKNHHLIPPQARNPLPSAFSPSFPPLSAAGDSPIADSQFPGMPRPLSASPLPTPSASQTRVGENNLFVGSRVRKPSQTHDSVGVLDPWGTDLHQKSPYDVAGVNAPQLQEVQWSNSNRAPNAVLQSGRLPNPSPLSQTTSAVHLPGPTPTPNTIRRRTLSKARIVGRLFSRSTDDVRDGDRPDLTHSTLLHGHAVSDGQGMLSGGVTLKTLSSRGQTAPAALGPDTGFSKVTFDVSGTTKKVRHTSLIGRLGKTLSVLRKPIALHEEREHRTFVHNKLTDIGGPRPLSVKRVPPPQPSELNDHASDRSLSLDIPLTMGNLTITNPDQASSGTASPVRRLSHAPQDNLELVSPPHSIAPLPPPKTVMPPAKRSLSPPKRSQPPLPHADSEEEVVERSGVLRVTNTLDMDLISVQSSSSPQYVHDHRDEPNADECLQDPSFSPLLPPPPLKDPASFSVRSPAVVSVSLSTATFSSTPPPPPQKPSDLINPLTQPNSPMQQDMDNLPDIATEPDLEAIQQRTTSRHAVSKENGQVQSPMLMNVEQYADTRQSAVSSNGAHYQAAPSASIVRSDIEQIPIRAQDRLAGIECRPHTILNESSVIENPSGNVRLSRISLYVNPPTPMQPLETIPLLTKQSPPPLPEPVHVQPPSSSIQAVAGDVSEEDRITRAEKKEKDRSERNGKRESRRLEEETEEGAKSERRHSRYDEWKAFSDGRHHQGNEHTSQLEEHQRRDKRDKRHEQRHSREHRESRQGEVVDYRRSRLDDEHERKVSRRKRRDSHHDELPGEGKSSRFEGRHVEKELHYDEIYEYTRSSHHDSIVLKDNRTSRYTNEYYDGTNDKRGSHRESVSHGKRESRYNAGHQNTLSSDGDEDWPVSQSGRRPVKDLQHIEKHDARASRHADSHPERRSSYDDSWYDRHNDRRSRHSEKHHEREAQRDSHRPERDTRYDDKVREKNERSTNKHRRKDLKPNDTHPDRESRHERRTHDEQSKRDDRGKILSAHDAKKKHESTRKEKSTRRDKKDRAALTTETFKLVRSRSDALRLMQDRNAIPISEEQWTLVETRESEKRKERHTDRHGERERSSTHYSRHKEYVAEEKRDDKRQRHHRHSAVRTSHDASLKSSIPFVTTPSEPLLRHQRSQSLDVPQGRRSSIPFIPEHLDARDRDSKNAHGSSSTGSRSSQTMNSADHRSSQSSVIPPPAPAPAKAERKVSLRRATSNLPAGADQLMSLSAREAWDAERAWRGTSVMYSQEGGIGTINGATSPTLSRNLDNIARSNRQNATSVAYAVHTSNSNPNGHAPVAHQNSFIAIPVPIAPNSSVVYAPQSTFSSTDYYNYSNGIRSFNDSANINTPLSNPLPEPPRQSTYSPDHEPFLSSSHPGAADDPNTQEYWSLIAGVATH